MIRAKNRILDTLGQRIPINSVIIETSTIEVKPRRSGIIYQRNLRLNTALL
tara:strand:- start:482 stop:634 length:153 start_codon:yes stop_codon:yes gene_type:complete